MADAKFTLGPWSFTKCPCGDRGCNQFTISTQGSVGFDEANAHLIAAAPDLYKALERWSNAMAAAGVWPVKDANDPFQDALAETHAALAKARGQ